MIATPELDTFQQIYDLRESKREMEPYQSIAIGAESGVRILQEAPVFGVRLGRPTTQSKYSVELGSNTYIWVIYGSGIPYVIEVPMPILGNKEPKHTNLTGGERAYVGGQLWFHSEYCMYVSGGSGRFPPLNEAQLEAVVDVFESFSYSVKSLGWNHATGRARRVLLEF